MIIFLKTVFERETGVTRDSKREHQWGGEREGVADSLWNREPDTGLRPRTWDHDLAQRQTPNQLSHPHAPHLIIFIIFISFLTYLIS